jgi:hypothetical protein
MYNELVSLKINRYVYCGLEYKIPLSIIIKSPLSHIYIELKLSPCKLTEPGFILTLVSGYRCRDI